MVRLSNAAIQERLGELRARGTGMIRNTSDAREIVGLAEPFLSDPKASRKLGTSAWSVLEQLADAALYLGQLPVADECILRLEEKFPASPRVNRLRGLRIEADGNASDALAFYDELLQKDGSNLMFLKRRVAVLRNMGDTRAALDELLICVDTFYSDLESWLELADLYESCASYSQALTALSHVMVLVPQNPFFALRAAECAYSNEDLPLALKYFLSSLELFDGDLKASSPFERTDAAGATTRGWYGVKLCATRLLNAKSSTHSPSPSETAPPSDKYLALLDELATERILAAYSSTASSKESGAPGAARSVVLKWLQG